MEDEVFKQGHQTGDGAQTPFLLLSSLHPSPLRRLSFPLSGKLVLQDKVNCLQLLQGNILAVTFKSTIVYRHDYHSPFALMWLVGVMTPSYAPWAIKKKQETVWHKVKKKQLVYIQLQLDHYFKTSCSKKQVTKQKPTLNEVLNMFNFLCTQSLTKITYSLDYM